MSRYNNTGDRRATRPYDRDRSRSPDPIRRDRNYNGRDSARRDYPRRDYDRRDRDVPSRDVTSRDARDYDRPRDYDRRERDYGYGDNERYDDRRGPDRYPNRDTARSYGPRDDTRSGPNNKRRYDDDDESLRRETAREDEDRPQHKGKQLEQDGSVSAHEEDNTIPAVNEPDPDDIAALMGFGGFGTTKGKEHSESDASGANIKQKRKFRQYMNRRGGFNRPLDPIK